MVKSIGLDENEWLIGNAMQTIQYKANGEASDWMLGELGIYAVSAEIGGETPETSTFFIE